MPAIGKYIREFRQAAGLAGRPMVGLCFEALRLRLGANRLGISEYLDYHAWAGGETDGAGEFEYIGSRMSRAIDRAMNQDAWRALANDKLLALQMLTAHGFPVPQTIAVYCPKGRSLAGARSFSSAAGFIDFLTEARPFPAFAKPIFGTYGRAAFLMTGHDPSAKGFALGDGSSLSAERLQTLMEFEPFHGFLLQRPIQQHGDLAQWVGSTICSARLMVLFTGAEPEPFCAFWKVATGSNMTDNFAHGRSGNGIAWIDIETGHVDHLVSGVGPEALVDDALPQPLADLVGRTLPNWNEGRELALKASRLFPGLGFQHWDIAFGAGGPLLVEVNTEPDLGVAQLCAGRGLLNARLKGAVREANIARQQHEESVSRASDYVLTKMVEHD